MKKYKQTMLLFFLFAAFLLSGCMKEAVPSGEEVTQESKKGFAVSEDEEKAAQESKKETATPNREEAAQESQAEDFLEIDGNLIERITVYHGESQETVDAASAKGRALVKMASGFFENPKASSLFLALGGICLESLDALGDVAAERKDDYFIQIELNQKSGFTLEDGDKLIAMVKERDIFIIETDQKEGHLALNWSDSDDENENSPLFVSVRFAREEERKMEEFIEKYKEWEQMEF